MKADQEFKRVLYNNKLLAVKAIAEYYLLCLVILIILFFFTQGSWILYVPSGVMSILVVDIYIKRRIGEHLRVKFGRNVYTTAFFSILLIVFIKQYYIFEELIFEKENVEILIKNIFVYSITFNILLKLALCHENLFRITLFNIVKKNRGVKKGLIMLSLFECAMLFTGLDASVWKPYELWSLLFVFFAARRYIYNYQRIEMNSILLSFLQCSFFIVFDYFPKSLMVLN